ncbi:MAG: trypsin-like serine protease [Actinomycetota bacterium]|nr:trypsin-like serine protease [Actinomycetota bacterium]
MMRKGMIILVTMASLVVSIANDAQAITDGEPDGSRHHYVGMVFDLGSDGSVGIACSGVLVSPRVFLTAGHCTEGFLSPPPDLSVQVSLAADATGLVSQATGTPHTYPGFCAGCAGGWGRNLGDLGVVVLDRPVRLTQYGSLPAVGVADTLSTGAPVTEVGYGLRSGVAGCTFSRCLPGDFGVRTLLRGLVLSGGSLSDTFVRSRGSGGACFGDSGGPILNGDGPTVLAVDSFVNDWSCKGVDYSFRIDQAPVLSWIKSWM